MAADIVHSPTPEELMEYMDGEGTLAARAGIEAHLVTCAACQALAAEQRDLSGRLGAWGVAPSPASMGAPHRAGTAVGRPWWRPARYVMAGLSVAAVILIVASSQARRAVPERPPVVRMQEAIDSVAPASSGRVAAGRASLAPPAMGIASQASASPTPHGPAVIRTVTLQIVAKDFSRVRESVDAILASTGGFADQLGLNADPGNARVLRGALRVPGDRLGDALTRLRALGQVTQDQQNAQDVADQLVDLDARLKNARATEQRLGDLLKNRTGKLADVLEVEQEISRVRLDIERLDAEKTNMTRRVAYATIDLTISEERKAGLDSGPLPLLTQLRVAAADGLQNVVDTVVGLTLFVLRAGPSLLLWGFAAGSAWFVVRRRRAARHSA